MVVNDFPVGNFDVAKNVRQQQKRKWEDSDTNKEPIVLKNKAPRVKFDKVSMFLSACSSGDLEEAKQLLNYGLDINSANPDGLTALHQACIYDKMDVVEFLLNHGADINCTDPEGWTPLHCAAYCGYSDITKILIEHKANLSSLNSNCELPLDLASDKPDIHDLVLTAMKNLKIDADSAKKSEETELINDAREWLRDGVRPSFRHPGSGATPLHVAASKGYLEAIQLLLQAGADVEAKDNDDWTPLMAAAHWSQIKACDLLLRAGANPGITSRLGFTLVDDIGAEDIRNDLRRIISENEARVKNELAKSSEEIKKGCSANESVITEVSVSDETKIPQTTPDVLSSNVAVNSAAANEANPVSIPSSADYFKGAVKATPLQIASTDEQNRLALRGTVVPVGENLVAADRKPSVSSVSSSDESSFISSSTQSTVGSRSNYATVSNGFRSPNTSDGSSFIQTVNPRTMPISHVASNNSRQNVIQPSSTGPSSAQVPMPAIVERCRPVSANLSSNYSDSGGLTSSNTNTAKLFNTNTTNICNNAHNSASLNNINKISSRENVRESLKMLPTSSLNVSNEGLGPGLSRALAEELTKQMPSTVPGDSLQTSAAAPSLHSTNYSRRPLAYRPLSNLVASEDVAVSLYQQQSSRNVPVFSMVHRSSSNVSSSASNKKASVIIQSSAVPENTRLSLTFTTTALTPTTSLSSNGFAALSHNSTVSNAANAQITISQTNSSNSPLPHYEATKSTFSASISSKERSSVRSSNDSPTTSSGMVAVLATPVTAVTPQHSMANTSMNSVLSSTLASNTGSTARSAADEAEAERKARARHNRQTRRATQGVTLEDFTQAKSIANAEQQQPMVFTAAPVVTSITAPASKQSSLAGSTVASYSTPVIGTVSPITQITPSVVYASSAMASSQSVPSSVRTGTGTLPAAAVPANNASASSNSSVSMSSSATTASSSRRRQQPRRSTGINQAEVSEAAEVLANTNETNVIANSVGQNAIAPVTADATVNAVDNSLSSSSSSQTSVPTISRRDAKPVESNVASSGSNLGSAAPSATASAGGASSFLVEYDRLYELERAENDRLKVQGRQMSTQLTELQRDKRSLQRRVSELEEETRELERLRAENQRLKDENCALIRVISKLSK